MTGSKVCVNLIDYLPTTPHVGTKPQPQPKRPDPGLDEFLRRYGGFNHGFLHGHSRSATRFCAQPVWHHYKI
jgi:hypothetical protein